MSKKITIFGKRRNELMILFRKPEVKDDLKNQEWLKYYTAINFTEMGIINLGWIILA
jgi:hypothetical protein